MCNYTESIGLIGGVTSIYILSTTTALLAIVFGLYSANFFKKKDGCQMKKSNFGQAKFNVEEPLEKHQMKIEEQKRSFGNYSEGSATQLYSGGLVSKLKSAHLRKLATQLTKEQLEDELRIEKEQLNSIFELLKKQETKFNTEEFGESQLKEQLHLYR